MSTVDDDPDGASSRAATPNEALIYQLSFTKRQILPNIVIVQEVRGNIDVRRLCAALSSIASHHQMLRSAFRVRPGQQGQAVVTCAIARSMSPTLELVDPSSLGEDPISDCIDRAHCHRFRLSQAPLWRFWLLRLAADRSVLIGSVHHIIADGTSAAILSRDLWQAYAGQALADTTDYFEYAHHLNSSEADGHYDRALKFWNQRIRQLPPWQSMFIHGRKEPQGPDRTTQLIHRKVRLSEKSGTQRRDRASLVLAALGSCLSARTQSGTALLSMVVSGRFKAEYQNTIGLFVNDVFVAFDRKAANDEVYEYARKLIFQSGRFSSVPRAHILQEAGLAERATRLEIPAILFNYLGEAEVVHYSIPGTDLEIEQMPRVRAQKSLFEISLFARSAESELDLKFEYWPELYDVGTMCELIEDTVQVLQELA